jgi:hypothetical protein
MQDISCLVLPIRAIALKILGYFACWRFFPRSFPHRLDAVMRRRPHVIRMRERRTTPVSIVTICRRDCACARACAPGTRSRSDQRAQPRGSGSRCGSQGLAWCQSVVTKLAVNRRALDEFRCLSVMIRLVASRESLSPISTTKDIR